MTYEEAVSYIETQGWSKTRLGLGRTRELLTRLGSPQRDLKFIHVAGSNGKGSCCAMTASVLQAAGYRTGLYISPHLTDFCERMSVDGLYISHDELAEYTARVASEADAMADHPSQFEISTAIAMLYFRAKRCDIVVLEVGMGGRLDSTNVIDSPEVACIMNIGLEHTEFLGKTLPEIAAQKAGIIKPGTSVVSYGNVPEVMQVLEDTCHENNVNLRVADFSALAVAAGKGVFPETASDLPVHKAAVPDELSASFAGQTFLYKGRKYFIPLAGAHQARNAAVVLEIAEALRERGWNLSEEAVRQGLAKASWPARGELLSEEPFFLLDGGHNPQCAGVLSDMLQEYLPHERVVFLIGLLRDKDRKAIYDIISPFAASFVCLTPDSDRAMPAEELAEEIRRETGKEAIARPDIPSGIQTALETGGKVVAFGSLYMAGFIRNAFPAALKRFLRKRCLAARRALTPEQRAEKSHTICEKLKALSEVQQSTCIFSYLAAPDEVNLREFNAWAVSAGKKVCYPVSSPSGTMDAYIPENPEAIEQGPFGIWAPIVEKSQKVSPEEIELIIAPCVGFDAAGNRLGHGAGYYDRYLKQAAGAQTVLVAFEAQRLPKCPVDSNDVAVQKIVTEK